MAYRQRKKDEEIDRIKQEQKLMIEKYLAIQAEKERMRVNKLLDEINLKHEKWKTENQQKELERQKQQEIERQEKAEKDRLEKEAKDAEYKSKKAAREAEDAKIAMVIQMCGPQIINGISNALTYLLGGQNKENTQEQENVNNNPLNDPVPEAD
jgi:microsomal dipeptidase-like Zn-dependent dipeptidase